MPLLSDGLKSDFLPWREDLMSRLIVGTGMIALTLLTAQGALGAGCQDVFPVPLNYKPLPNAAFLDGQRIYAQDAVPGEVANEEWFEDHCSGGALFKVAAGVGDPVDPYKEIGTWTDNQDGTITYDYGSPATTYTWKLYVRKGGGLCWEDTDANPPSVIATGNRIGSNAASPCTD